MSQIKLQKASQIKSQKLTIKTANADDGPCNGGSDAAIGGILTRQCDRSDHDGDGDAGTVYVDVDLACS